MPSPGRIHSVQRTLVVADDDELVREGIASHLRADGHRVLTACDGIEAIDVLRRTEMVDLLLLDLTMPRLDGLGVLAALSRESRLSSVPVVVMCATPDRAPPGVVVAEKPFDADSVRALVTPLLGQRGQSGPSGTERGKAERARRLEELLRRRGSMATAARAQSRR